MAQFINIQPENRRLIPLHFDECWNFFFLIRSSPNRILT